MAGYMSASAEVEQPMQLYIDGANGDVEKLRKAFHPTATMMGHIRLMETYVPNAEFFSTIECQPGAAGPNHQAKVRTIDLTGDAGVAVLAETDDVGCDFVDHSRPRAAARG